MEGVYPGQLGWDEYDEARLSTMTKAEASRLIDALQDVAVADREQPSEPPDDPWQTELVPAQAEGA